LLLRALRIACKDCVKQTRTRLAAWAVPLHALIRLIARVPHSRHLSRRIPAHSVRLARSRHIAALVVTHIIVVVVIVVVVYTSRPPLALVSTARIGRHAAVIVCACIKAWRVHRPTVLALVPCASLPRLARALVSPHLPAPVISQRAVVGPCTPVCCRAQSRICAKAATPDGTPVAVNHNHATPRWCRIDDGRCCGGLRHITSPRPAAILEHIAAPSIVQAHRPIHVSHLTRGHIAKSRCKPRAPSTVTSPQAHPVLVNGIT